ncbi:hypothetical protein HPB52_004959 [Rhipicephalus sanguineus]|uniref:Uncharacterized protein n=1 Tax=Rhipicephalus sanguineus TaxID=34632 RepID=A0A9D4PLS5_RHISA|nr:hypothetical protein HPB52_004959 [Rhipicephalus sanguineus]
MALQGQTRRKAAELHRRAIIAETRSRTAPSSEAAFVAARAALVLHEHVAFGTPVGLTTAPAWYTLRLLQANIGPIEKEIHNVVLRHTRHEEASGGHGEA